MRSKEEVRKREEEKILFSYHLAKEIADFAKDYREVDEIIRRVKWEIDQAACKRRPIIRERPTDGWGEPLGVEK